ncbi:MAG: hypothetical protein R2795_13635 [Saprospiraceae bacterium]
MKSVKLIITMLFLAGLFVGLHAQTRQYHQTMKTLKAQLIKAEKKDAFIALRNQFNRIALVETEEWLPCYYETFCTLAWAFEEEDETIKAKLANEIGVQLEALEESNGEPDEVAVLKGRWLQLRSGLPGENFMQIGLQLYNVIPPITEKYPDNPRGWLLLGELIINAPKGFMGYSEQDAINAFLKSKSLLKGVDEHQVLAPTWGLSIANAHLTRLGANPKEVAPATGDNSYDLLDQYYAPNGGISHEKAIGLFEEKSKAFPSDYIWKYHHVFSIIQTALNCENIAQVDPYCDQAEALLAELPEDTPKDEVLCLNALLQVTRIRVSFQKRGLKYYMASETMLNQAFNINPNNPRIQFLKGQNQKNLPKEMGGGATSAQPYFEKCKELSALASNNPNIRWGCKESVNL